MSRAYLQAANRGAGVAPIKEEEASRRERFTAGEDPSALSQLLVANRLLRGGVSARSAGDDRGGHSGVEAALDCHRGGCDSGDELRPLRARLCLWNFALLHARNIPKHSCGANEDLGMVSSIRIRHRSGRHLRAPSAHAENSLVAHGAVASGRGARSERQS